MTDGDNDTGGCPNCTGCGLTFDFLAEAQVPTTGGNYAMSGVSLPNQPATSSHGLGGLFVDDRSIMPSGAYYTIYDPQAEQSIKILNIWLMSENGKCAIVDGDCKEDTKCPVYNIYLFVDDDGEFAHGDIAFRINGGAVQLANENHTANPQDPPILPGFGINIDTKVACGSDLTVEIEFVPNNSTLPLPAGYDNWATGMKFTFHCAKCVGTEDPV
jgi:hypothetical protein